MSNPYAASVQRVPGPIRLAVFGASALVCAYFCLTATGPYAWIVQAQLAVLDSYFMMISILTTFLVCALPASLMLALMGLAFSGNEDGPAGPGSLSQRIERAPRSFGLGLASLGCLIVGGYFLGSSLMYGEQTSYRLTSKSTWPPKTRYLKLRGEHVPKSAMVWSDDHSRTVYALLGPRTRGKSGGYRVVLKASESTYEDLLAHAKKPIEGTLELAPSDIIADDLKDAGYRLADDARIFDVGNTPEKSRGLGLILLCTGLIGAVVSAGAFAFFSRPR